MRSNPNSGILSKDEQNRQTEQVTPKKRPLLRLYLGLPLRDFIRYAKQFDDVWFATRGEIAAWYMENHASHIEVN